MVSTALVCRILVFAGLFMSWLPTPHAAESGLISKLSNRSVEETAKRFEQAVKAKEANGWMVFTEIDHAAAASKNGLTLKPRPPHRVWQPQTRDQANGGSTNASDRRAPKGACLAG
jgi:hypothetical protein